MTHLVCQLAFLVIYHEIDSELHCWDFSFSCSIYITLSIAADTNVPHLSHTRYSPELSSNVCGTGSATGLLRKLVEIICAELEQWYKASRTP